MIKIASSVLNQVFERIRSLRVPLLLCMSITSTGVLAQEGVSVLITNVHIVDPTAEPVNVNILIENGNVALASPDDIPIDEGVPAFDARGGFIIGKVEIGKPANFIVLDDNPQDTPRVLLDTKEHTLFAMLDGGGSEKCVETNVKTHDSNRSRRRRFTD